MTAHVAIERFKGEGRDDEEGRAEDDEAVQRA
jgi:hypothetical protein